MVRLPSFFGTKSQAHLHLLSNSVVACTIYLANYVEDFAAFNEAYLVRLSPPAHPPFFACSSPRATRQRLTTIVHLCLCTQSMFTGPIKPSRTCIGVAALAEGTDVEITATALLRTGGPKKAISSANAPPPAPFLSSAIGTDELVFVSGSCGVKDGKFIEGTVQDRTTLALKNVEALLKEEGLDLGDGKSPNLKIKGVRTLTVLAPSHSRRFDRLLEQVQGGLCVDEQGLHRRLPCRYHPYGHSNLHWSRQPPRRN